MTAANPIESKHYVVTDHGLAELPHALPEHKQETPETVALKLRKVGYGAPKLPRQQFICITLGCQAKSDRPGPCEKCRRDIAAGKFDPITWEKVLVGLLIAITVLLAISLLGKVCGWW